MRLVFQLFPQPLQGPLLDPGYIAAADVQFLRNLPLPPGHGSKKAVSHTDHLPLLFCQAAGHRFPQQPGILPGMERFQQILISRHRILQLQRFTDALHGGGAEIVMGGGRIHGICWADVTKLQVEEAENLCRRFLAGEALEEPTLKLSDIDWGK